MTEAEHAHMHRGHRLDACRAPSSWDTWPPRSAWPWCSPRSPASCATPTCRGTVTGADWRLPQLHAKYAGWFSPYLARRIAALEQASCDQAALT